MSRTLFIIVDTYLHDIDFFFSRGFLKTYNVPRKDEKLDKNSKTMSGNYLKAADADN